MKSLYESYMYSHYDKHNLSSDNDSVGLLRAYNKSFCVLPKPQGYMCYMNDVYSCSYYVIPFYYILLREPLR